MPKDYHKGKKINAYIPEELYILLEECADMYDTSKTSIITDALYSFIGKAARDSIHKSIEERAKNGDKHAMHFIEQCNAFHEYKNSNRKDGK